MSGPAWRPSLGAWPEEGGVRFRVWAPERRQVTLVIERPAREPLTMEAGPDGHHSALVPGLEPGALYRYRLDDEGPFPDPASRCQRQGVHGPSEVVDPAYAWTDAGWSGLRPDELVIYELHPGTFTAQGGFAGVRERLPYLRDLGVTAVELMPVGDFPGGRNWGYDGVALFAPARCYGRPDDLRALVDEAHRLGLGVLLDVVYNHFGPDGAYHGVFSRFYYTERHRTPWGSAINLSDRHHEHVRGFLTENALHWLHEYHFDGLRLDATHAMEEEGQRPFLAGLVRACRERGRPGVAPVLVAEDSRNLDWLVRPARVGGCGFDGVWADDLHHQVRRGLAGDREGYFRDFSGSAADLARTARQGFFFTGQHSDYAGGPRGTDPSGIPPHRFVVCIQNHDQVGNRALGTRLNHDIAPEAFRAATVLLLCLPETPLLFMGQEWAASSPFLYFTDHASELGRLVTEGRRKEFAGFRAFSDPAARERIPDPQAEETFLRSRLEWNEAGREPHASMLRLVRALLALRREEPLLRSSGWDGFSAEACGPQALALSRTAEGAGRLLVVVRLAGEGTVEVPAALADPAPAPGPWRVLLSSEDPAFAPDARPIEVSATDGAPGASFARPGAVVLRLES